MGREFYDERPNPLRLKKAIGHRRTPIAPASRKILGREIDPQGKPAHSSSMTLAAAGGLPAATFMGG
ncbi:MAG: hypothetical protein CMJ89_01150 [Planctomycetes bacterium]|nr:hypothetical protein [Planctomycetota bacterium]